MAMETISDKLVYLKHWTAQDDLIELSPYETSSLFHTSSSTIQKDFKNI